MEFCKYKNKTKVRLSYELGLCNKIKNQRLNEGIFPDSLLQFVEFFIFRIMSKSAAGFQ